MKNLLVIALWLFALAVSAQEKRYVTDQIQVMVRSGIGTDFKIVNQLTSGASVTLLAKDQKKGYSQIRMKNGKVGWIISRYLTDRPIARWLLSSATKKLGDVETENARLKQMVTSLQETSSETQSKNEALSTQSGQLSQELENIQKTAANALKIQRQRDQFQERVIGLEREMQKLNREKLSLQDSSSQDWFLIGAGVLLGGIVLGLILPRISWRRKSTSWDSF